MPFFTNYKNKKLKKLITVLFTSQFFCTYTSFSHLSFFCDSVFSVCLALTETYVKVTLNTQSELKLYNTKEKENLFFIIINLWHTNTISN